MWRNPASNNGQLRLLAPHLAFPDDGEDLRPIVLSCLIAALNHLRDNSLAFADGILAMCSQYALCRKQQIFGTDHVFPFESDAPSLFAACHLGYERCVNGLFGWFRVEETVDDATGR